MGPSKVSAEAPCHQSRHIPRFLNSLASPAPARSVQRRDYTSSLNRKVKVLDFVKSGGPEWTVDGTIFEMWLGAL